MRGWLATRRCFFANNLFQLVPSTIFHKFWLPSWRSTDIFCLLSQTVLLEIMGTSAWVPFFFSVFWLRLELEPCLLVALEVVLFISIIFELKKVNFDEVRQLFLILPHFSTGYTRLLIYYRQKIQTYKYRCTDEKGDQFLVLVGRRVLLIWAIFICEMFLRNFLGSMFELALILTSLCRWFRYSV